MTYRLKASEDRKDTPIEKIADTSGEVGSRQKDKQRWETKEWARLVKKHPCHVKVCPWWLTPWENYKVIQAGIKLEFSCAYHYNKCSQVSWHKTIDREISEKMDTEFFLFLLQLWPWMIVKVIQTDIKMLSLVVSIITPSLKEICQ